MVGYIRVLIIFIHKINSRHKFIRNDATKTVNLTKRTIMQSKVMHKAMHVHWRTIKNHSHCSAKWGPTDSGKDFSDSRHFHASLNNVNA